MLAAGAHWHYSNLAYGLLGEVVERLGERPYAGEPASADSRAARAQPDAASRPTAPVAKGYFVEPYSDGVRREPDLDLPETTAAMGQLWSTTGDLARWGAFLAAGDEAVLPQGRRSTRWPASQVMADEERGRPHGGSGSVSTGEATASSPGHGGAMPGFLAMLLVNRPSATGAVVLANSSAQVPSTRSRSTSSRRRSSSRRPTPRAWAPDEGVPDEVAPLLGRWWTEGSELVALVARRRAPRRARRSVALEPPLDVRLGRRRPLAVRRGTRARRAAPRRARRGRRSGAPLLRDVPVHARAVHLRLEACQETLRSPARRNATATTT